MVVITECGGSGEIHERGRTLVVTSLILSCRWCERRKRGDISNGQWTHTGNYMSCIFLMRKNATRERAKVIACIILYDTRYTTYYIQLSIFLICYLKNKPHFLFSHSISFNVKRSSNQRTPYNGLNIATTCRN